jgi:hypothetical protein
MYHLGVRHQRGRWPVIAASTIFGLILVAFFVGRHSLLRTAGWMLVADDPIRPADAIVIAVDAGDAGVLEAADLVRSGVSQTVALFDGPPSDVDRELTRRGVNLDDEGHHKTRLLRTLGVDRVELIPWRITGTEDEGHIFPKWCDELQLRSVIIVTSADHTRRLRRVFHRAMKGRATTVMVRRAHFSQFDPDRWWSDRDGVRTEVVELEKLLFDIIRHPIS